MSNRWIEINDNLRLCRKVFAILKQKNPHIFLNLDHIDILAYRKNNKNCSISDASQKLGIEDDDDHWLAHFDDRGKYNDSTHEWERKFWDRPHVCIKQHILFFPFTIPSWQEDPDNVPKKRMHWIEGNWAIIEIMCHELTLSKILGHDKDFFKLFYKFLSQMAETIFSGDFYYWYTRQHESRELDDS